MKLISFFFVFSNYLLAKENVQFASKELLIVHCTHADIFACVTNAPKNSGYVWAAVPYAALSSRMLSRYTNKYCVLFSLLLLFCWVIFVNIFFFFMFYLFLL